MENKQLSIIIPAYNSEKYIEKCLLSLKSFSEFVEILVINDGSRDDTVGIVENCAQRDKKIKLINVPNGGVSRARNIGLDNADGKFLMFLDSDDYLLEEGVEVIQRCIKAEQYDFTAFSRRIIECDGGEWDQNFSFNGEKNTDKDSMDRIMYADSLLNECWGKLFKKKIVDGLRLRFPVDVPIGEDLMFVMEYYTHCMSSCAYNIPLVAYRQHGDSAMKKYGIDQRIEFTQNLYEYTKMYIPDKIKKDSIFYNFKVLTNLCREYSKELFNVKSIRIIYNSTMAREVLAGLNINDVPTFRIHEYFLMKYRMVIISALYYRIKAFSH